MKNQVNEYPWILTFADKTGGMWSRGDVEQQGGCGATLVGAFFPTRTSLVRPCNYISQICQGKKEFLTTPSDFLHTQLDSHCLD